MAHLADPVQEHAAADEDSHDDHAEENGCQPKHEQLVGVALHAQARKRWQGETECDQPSNQVEQLTEFRRKADGIDVCHGRENLDEGDELAYHVPSTARLGYPR